MSEANGRWITDPKDDRAGFYICCGDGAIHGIRVPFYECPEGPAHVLCVPCARKLHGVEPPPANPPTCPVPGCLAMHSDGSTMHIDARGRGWYDEPAPAVTIAGVEAPRVTFASRVDPIDLARAIFDVEHEQEAEQIAESDMVSTIPCSDCGIGDPCERHAAQTRRVLEIMWERTKPDAREDATFRAQRYVAAMNRRAKER